MSVRIALVGDYRPDSVVAHRAIPIALERLGAAWEWVPTDDAQVRGFDAIWCVPGSPYASAAGAIGAIRYARENGVPFLGTCGGFQHLLLEWAESAWGIASPAHAEERPDAPDPVISLLACSLVEATETLTLAPGSRLAAAYGALSATEGYRCRFGLNPLYAARLESGPLKVAAWGEDGGLRAVALDDHPFFVGCLFQPERAALTGRIPPLAQALVDATQG